MSNTGYRATVTIVAKPQDNLDSEAAAADYFSALLSENETVLDWGYEKYPEPLEIPDDYIEGDFLSMEPANE